MVGDNVVGVCLPDEPSGVLHEFFNRQAHQKHAKPPHIRFAGLKKTPDHAEALSFLETYGPLWSWGARRFQCSLKEFWGAQEKLQFLVSLHSLLAEKKVPELDLRLLLAQAWQRRHDAQLGVAILYPFVAETSRRQMRAYASRQGDHPKFLEWILEAPMKHLTKLGRYLLCFAINEEIGECKFRLQPPGFYDEFGPRPLHSLTPEQFTAVPTPSELIDCLYIMLAYDAAHRTEIAFCRDPRCMRPFPRDRANKLYCGRDCANRVMVRRHYHRTKSARKGP